MGVSPQQLQRIVAQARRRETQGYFVRVRAGDQRAASLFARLIAYDLNPTGLPNDVGWLSKQPGETQVDGWAEDAVCGNADAFDLQNVVDLVNGAGAPNASIGWSVKERRENNKWVAPQALTSDEASYLLAGGPPIPIPIPQPPQYPPYPQPETLVDGAGVALFADFGEAGQPPNPQMFRFVFRVAYSWLTKEVPSLEASVAKHRKEWRALLGLP